MVIRWISFYGSSYAVLAFALAGVVGCGGAYDSKVSGKVTLDGNVVARGTVSYDPVQGGPPGYARVDESGNYVVFTGRQKGLPSGDYQVTIIANEAPVSQVSSTGGPPPGGKPITPVWYRTKDTSGLQFTVKPGSNEIDLELKSQPPAGWKPGARR